MIFLNLDTSIHCMGYWDVHNTYVQILKPRYLSYVPNLLLSVRSEA